MKKAAKTAPTHSSDEILDKGSELVAFIEAELEKTYTEHFSWEDVFRVHKSLTFHTLHNIFRLHREYAFQNMESQRSLITDVDIADRTLIISEISVIESQKQTIERLMSSYTSAIFAKQSEIASRKSNTLALIGIFVAVAAVMITSLRLHALLK